MADYRPARTGDAVAHRIDKRCWQPFAMPHSSFRSERTYGGKTFRKPVPNADTSRQQFAYAFATHRNGGAMLLNHRTITPARPREMTTSQAREPLPLAVDRLHESGIGDYLRPEPAPRHSSTPQPNPRHGPTRPHLDHPVRATRGGPAADMPQAASSTGPRVSSPQMALVACSGPCADRVYRRQSTQRENSSDIDPRPPLTLDRMGERRARRLIDVRTEPFPSVYQIEGRQHHNTKGLHTTTPSTPPPTAHKSPPGLSRSRSLAGRPRHPQGGRKGQPP
jgi:hypothetical protein